MEDVIRVGLVRCSETPLDRSEMVATSLRRSEIEERLISTVQQQVSANEAKGLHLAAAHPDHGRVTYLQEVTE